MKRINVVENPEIYKFGSVHFFVHDSSTESTELARKSKVSMWSKVRGFYGISFSLTRNYFSVTAKNLFIQPKIFSLYHRLLPPTIDLQVPSIMKCYSQRSFKIKQLLLS